MRIFRLTLACLLLLATAPLGGCMISHGMFDPLSAGSALDESQLRFSRLVRWQQWEKAAEMVHPDARDDFEKMMRALNGVQFTDWELTEVDVAEDFETAHVEILIEGYSPRTMINHQAIMVQEWERMSTVTHGWVVSPHLDALADKFGVSANR